MSTEMIKVHDRKVVLSDAKTVWLSGFWADGPLVLVFLRHYG